VTRNKNRAARFNTIALMGNPQDRRTLDSMQVLTAHLLAAGRKVQASDSLRARALPRQVRRVPDVKDRPAAPTWVIAIGGDGSMLYAARRIAGRKTPLLGINRGRLGFLADVGPEQMLARVDEVLAGKYVSEQRMLLLVDLRDGDDIVASGTALNDVVVKRHATGRMCEYQTFVDGRYVNTHLGDGFIVSTPTGSTAYALSCGGARSSSRAWMRCC
jgi:NAD+ kinase